MKDDTSTPTSEGDSPNEFERGKPGTADRSRAEAAIEDLRKRGGVFVDAVRATRMPMALTDPNLPGNPIVFANEAFLKLSGYSMEDVLGQGPHFMNGPHTDVKDAARFTEALRADQDDIIETIQYRKNGSRFVATVLISAFKDEQGRTLIHFMSWLDVTRRVDAEDEVAQLKTLQSALQQSAAALRSSERRRESALIAADMGTWDYDLIADVCHFDARAQEMYNLSSDQLDHRPEGVGPVVHPDDVGPMFEEIQRASDPKGEGRYDMVYRIAQADGTYRWLRAVGITEFEGSGESQRAVRIVGASRDITLEREAETALRESERHAQTLLAELQHRVRNSLAVVRSIARRTADRSTDLEGMMSHFEGRLNAFSRVQSAVTRSGDAGVDLGAIIEDELLAVATREGQQLRIKGPALPLKSRSAESISLGIHELATNAVKYGALSLESGRVQVQWKRARDGEAVDELELEWVESGLAERPEPKREGFGHEMLLKSLPYDLGARTSITFTDDGLRFTMSLPLVSDVLAEEA